MTGGIKVYQVMWMESNLSLKQLYDLETCVSVM